MSATSKASEHSPVAIDELVAISRRYGSNPEYVLAGGGNTSWKNESSLFVKASGFPLSTIGADGFVKMERRKLAEIWSANYPTERASREAGALRDLMGARSAGEEAKRPSVETLVHEAFGAAYVVHTHPALVNGLTCSRGGRERAVELFGNRALWIPMIDPGYMLATSLRAALSEYVVLHRKEPEFVLLQNHGIFVSADEPAVIDTIYGEVFDTLNAVSAANPDLTSIPGRKSEFIEHALLQANAPGTSISFAANSSLDGFLSDSDRFAPLSSAYTPDHIVYAGHRPLYYEGEMDDHGALQRAVSHHEAAIGRKVKVVAVKGLGAFGIGSNAKAAETALTLFLDALKIAVYAESHGGAQFLAEEMTEFILDWEVEKYRMEAFR